jgi:hypothetical protein
MHMFLLLNNLNTMFVGLVDANVCWFTIWLFNVVNWTTTICTARYIYIYICPISMRHGFHGKRLKNQ